MTYKKTGMPDMVTVYRLRYACLKTPRKKAMISEKQGLLYPFHLQQHYPQA